VIPLIEWAPCFAECFAGLEGVIIGGLEAKQTLLDALAADDPDFFTDLTEQKPAA
jgi:hypothetical protein